MQSASPGQVLRILERLARSRSDLPAVWLLSTPTALQGFRILLAESSSGEAAETIAAPLCDALGTPVHYMTLEPDRWTGVSLSTPEAEPERETGRREKTTKFSRLLPPFVRGGAWKEWARTRGLPGHLITQNGEAIQGQRIPYRTVAKLDQRSLLVERVNVWYELTLGDA